MGISIPDQVIMAVVSRLRKEQQVPRSPNEIRALHTPQLKAALATTPNMVGSFRFKSMDSDGVPCGFEIRS